MAANANEESKGAENIVLPDGKCKNKVHFNFVTCLICSSKFHATGCSNDIDICTPSFLSSFRPFSEKVAPKYAARPGTFHFVCDACLTEFEINRASSRDDKVDSLSSKVSSLESGLNEIKAMLRNQSRAPASEMNCDVASGLQLPHNSVQQQPLAPCYCDSCY